MMNEIQLETAILKGLMREQKLNTKGLLHENYQNMDFKQQKDMFQLRKQAKARVQEIRDKFFSVDWRKRANDEEKLIDMINMR